MKGLGKFQMEQMKHRDARVFMLCQHLRSAIDILEQIASDPYQPPVQPTQEEVACVPSHSAARVVSNIGPSTVERGISFSASSRPRAIAFAFQAFFDEEIRSDLRLTV
jgi:hypothetical protein